MTAAAVETGDTLYDFRITGQNILTNSDHIIMNNTQATVRVHIDHSGAADGSLDVYFTLGPGEATTWRNGSVAGSSSTIFGYVQHTRTTAAMAPRRTDQFGDPLAAASAQLTFSPF